jgi:SAM-dependent methyltransferase
MEAPVPDAPSTAGAANAAYYGTLARGREDYWRKMAAPRFRVGTLLRLLRQHGAQRVVDLGCGNGQLLSAILEQRRGLELCGIDLSESQIAQNERRMPDVRWSCADLDRPVELPVHLDTHFDAVVASEIIEHVDHPEVFLANARRLAANGGLLLLSTQSGPIRPTEVAVGHHRHFTAMEMRSLLERAGWQPLEVWNAGFPFHDLSKWMANLSPQASMARFGDKPYGPLENAVCALLRFAFWFNSSRRGAQLFAVARRVDAS